MQQPHRGLPGVRGYSSLYDYFKHVLVYAKLIQSFLTLCDPMDYSPPGFSVHGIPQARALEWVAIFSSRGSSRPRDQTSVS